MSGYNIKEKAGKISPRRPTEMEKMETPVVYQLSGHHEFLEPSINICDKRALPFHMRPDYGQED